MKQLTLTAIILGGAAAIVTGGFGLAAGGAVASNVAFIVGGALGGGFGGHGTVSGDAASLY